MPPITIQDIGELSYNRPRTSTEVATTLAASYDILAAPALNKTSEDVWFDLDPDTVAQISTITIAAGSTDDLYTVSIADGTTTDRYTYRQEVGDTASIIAASLAPLLDLHPGVKVTATNNVITVTGVRGGVAITITVSASTTAGNLVVATPTAAAGTPKFVKVMNITTEKTLTTSGTNKGFPKVAMLVTYYDGDDTTPVVLTTKEVSATGPRSLDEIQTNNGITRPV